MTAQREIREVDVADLQPAPWNPRAMDDAARAGLDASLDRWGLVQPVIWNERSGYVVGGHQRLHKLLRDGVERTIVVVVDLDESEERALNVALNNPHIAGQFVALDVVLADIKVDLSPADFTLLRFDTLDDRLSFGDDGLADAGMPEIPLPGEQNGLTQITFTLEAESQAETVKHAVEKAIANGDAIDPLGVNTNKNGNAIAAICAAWLASGGGHG